MRYYGLWLIYWPPLEVMLVREHIQFDDCAPIEMYAACDLELSRCGYSLKRSDTCYKFVLQVDASVGTRLSWGTWSMIWSVAG